MSINQFVKDWHVWYVTGVGPVLQRGARLSIGTSEETRPALGGDGLPCVGYVIALPDGTTYTSAEHGPLVLVDGVLRWNGEGTRQILKRMYVALAEALTESGEPYSYLYGTTVEGDPEQVVVWGANDGPPPAPAA